MRYGKKPYVTSRSLTCFLEQIASALISSALCARECNQRPSANDTQSHLSVTADRHLDVP